MIGVHIYPAEYYYLDKEHTYYTRQSGNENITLSFHKNLQVEHIYEDSNFIVLIDGWVFNAANYQNQAQFVLKLYKKFGHSVPQYLNGQFNIVIINKKSDNYIFFNDLINIRKHFYSTCKNRLYYTSDICFLKKIIKSNAIDKYEVAKHIKFPRFLGQNTNYKNIHISIGSMYYKNNSSLSKYKIQPIYDQFNREAKSSADILYQFKRNVENVHKDGKILLEISGGMDSRFLGEIFKSLSLDVNCINWGTQISDECSIAKSVTGALGYLYYGVELQPAQYTVDKDAFINTYGGLDIFVQSAAKFAFEKNKKSLPPNSIIDTGLALDIYLRNTYPENTHFVEPKRYLLPHMDRKIREIKYSNWNKFIENNRIFTVLALRQSLHREYFDDRYSMYSYENYFLMQSLQNRNRNKLSDYVDILKDICKNTLNIPIQSTMKPITVPINEWDALKNKQQKTEIKSLNTFKNTCRVNYHHRYYSDFDMWLRSSIDWKSSVECLYNINSPIYDYVDKQKIDNIINQHMKGEKSHYADLIQLITMNVFLSQNISQQPAS